MPTIVFAYTYATVLASGAVNSWFRVEAGDIPDAGARGGAIDQGYATERDHRHGVHAEARQARFRAREVRG